MHEKFIVQIDASHCTSIVEGVAHFGRDYGIDCWRYRNLQCESGKIYGLIGEYGHGCMYLSYLLGGKINFDDLRIYLNGTRIVRSDLERISWNLEPNRQFYGKKVVKKAIESACKKNKLESGFAEIQEKFCLTSKRENMKLKNLSGERWRASAAVGFAEKKKIFYAPYETSTFYYDMCGSTLLKALRELTDKGAMVVLPAGSDDFLKYIADECIFLKRDYDIDRLRQRYQELFQKGDWIL